MARSTFDPTTKKAALFSGLLHLFALLFMMLGVIFANLFAKEEEPHIFEMVALPESALMAEEMTFEPLPEVSVDIPEPEPIELPPPPEPEPEPVQETPPPPKPEPQPVIQETPPPPPVPVEKPPEPKPEPKPKPKPKIITLDQYEREHGEIKDPPKEAYKPTPKPQRRNIDTSKIEQEIKRITSGVPDLIIDAPPAAVDNDAMRNWRALLAARLDALWKQIDTKGAAGKSVRVSFLISAGGSISSVKVISSSGIPQLDSLGVQTVQRLSSFMPPPSGKAETVTVRLKVE